MSDDHDANGIGGLDSKQSNSNSSTGSNKPKDDDRVLLLERSIEQWTQRNQLLYQARQFCRHYNSTRPPPSRHVVCQQLQELGHDDMSLAAVFVIVQRFFSVLLSS